MRVLFVCTILLVLAACKKDKIDNSKASDLFPNKIGDSWVYLVNDTTRVNNQVTDIKSYNMTVSVMGTKDFSPGSKANV